MEKNRLKIALVVAFLLFSTQASADTVAHLELSSSSTNLRVGDSFNVDINLEPNGQPIDMARANIKFSSDTLELEDVFKNSSFNFSAGGNFIDNGGGSFSYGSGIPGGTEKDSHFLTLVFKVKKEGVCKISLDGTSLLLREGENIMATDTPSLSVQLIKGTSTLATSSAASLTAAEKEFKRIYLRKPDYKKFSDKAAVEIMARGLAGGKRNLASERAALKTYVHIYKSKPSSSKTWNILKAIAYSGAKR